MSARIEMIKALRNSGFTMQEINTQLRLTTSKRDELLRVATQLAAGMLANSHPDYEPTNISEAVKDSVIHAKDLIVKVDAEVGL